MKKRNPQKKTKQNRRQALVANANDGLSPNQANASMKYRNDTIPRTIYPSYYYVWLKFKSHTTGATSTGLNYGSIQWYANSSYTVAVASDTSLPNGRDEWATIFSNALVCMTRAKMNVVNRENFTVTCSLAFYTEAVTIGSTSEADDNAERRFSDIKVLSAKGGLDNKSLVLPMIDIPTALGNKVNYFGDLSFYSLGNAVPSNKFYYVFAVFGQSGTTLDVGIDLSFNVKMLVKFENPRVESQVNVRRKVAPMQLQSNE